MASFALPLIGGAISTVGSLFGLKAQTEAVKAASAAQANAATTNAAKEKAATDAANQFTQTNLNSTVADNSPYQAAGSKALSQLSSGTAPGGVFNSTPTGDQVLAQDPGYDFRMKQGQLALSRAESASGGVGGGGGVKAGIQYGQDYASNEYSNAYQRFMGTRQNNFSNLSNIANFGQNANQLVAGARTSADGTVANTTLAGTGAETGQLSDAANARAGGYIGIGNAQTAAISGIGTAAQQTLAQLGHQSSDSGYGSGPNANTPTWNPATGQEVYPH